MKTVLRIAVVLAVAALATPAFARSPLSNGLGDGEANVPFATLMDEDELGGGAGEPGLAPAAPIRYEASPLSNGLGDGEANVPFATIPARAGAEELGGGTGEPGRGMDDAARAAADAEFERHVWTDP